MIRRTIFEQVGGYREAVSGAEDWDLFLRLAEVSRLAMGPKTPLYRYRHYAHLPVSQLRARRRAMAVVFKEAIYRRYGYRVRWEGGH